LKFGTLVDWVNNWGVFSFFKNLPFGLRGVKYSKKSRTPSFEKKSKKKKKKSQKNYEKKNIK